MSKGTRLASALFLFIIAAALLVLNTDGAEAADMEFTDDWVISGTTVQVTDKTIDVIGNVTVRSGGVLKLYNSTLDIQCVVNGQFDLEVQSGGRLEAYDSTILGTGSYVDYWFRDNVVMVGCQVSHVNGAQSGGGTRGIMVAGGTVSMTDTTVSDCRYHGIYAQAPLNLDNVTVEDVENTNVFMSNWGASAGDFSVSIRDSTFNLATNGGWYVAGVYFGRWGGDPDMDLTLSGSTFSSGTQGVYISGGSNSDVVIDDCDFIDCEEGISMSTQTSSGDYTISNNRIDANDRADSVGLSLTVADDFAPTLTNNVVEEAHTAYALTGPWSGSATTRIGGLVVGNCTRGLVTDRTVHLTVHNSTFTHISGALDCFVADGGSTITIYDTEHPWGSGTVADANSWIRAHIDIGILGAKWKNGGSIARGEVVLENITKYEVARFNLSNVRPQDMVGWEVTNTDRRTSLFLYPAMYIDGHGFRGERMDLRTYRPSIVELVDDRVPSLDIASPGDGDAFNVTTVLAGGSIDELGSGTDMIEYSLDGGLNTILTTWTGTRWDLALTSLSEGWHNLTLRPRDKVGNQGDTVYVRFYVDTVVPFIDLTPPPELVNTSTVLLEGLTEPGVDLTVNGIKYYVTKEGRIAVDLDLQEGDNAFEVHVADLAGNSNSSWVFVTRDMTFPDLTITAPEPDEWTNERSVYVEGTAEDRTVLTVNGGIVDVINGTYRRRVDLDEGNFIVTVTCTDPAGNTAVKTRLILVDWTPPTLDIVEPETSEVYVRESSVYISGDVDDPTIDHVMVNDQSVPLTNGRFVKQFTVLEGITEFVVTVEDAAGNGVSERIVVIRDLTPPSYESTITAIGGELLVKDGDQYCTASAVEVFITTNEVSTFSLGGNMELAQGTEVRHRFELIEGANTLEVYISDVAGNQAQTFRQTVEVDTTAPIIDVQSPQPGYRTKEDTVTIHGFTEMGTTLTLNGETVNVLSGGEFRHIVALVEGRNEFTLDVEDAMGNSNSASLSVLRDSGVTTGETATTGSTTTGFVLGLVVGIVLMAAFVYVRGRGRGPDDEPPGGPRPPEPREPFHAPDETQEGAGEAAGGGWEEY
jgi:hypothetical protein